ncbi:hypothetical protein DFH06DRAFT_602977 [Mycena polygramma]|nr:hypothetical protein DFH06DRAFT_602977 [Mycena polygramma]
MLYASWLSFGLLASAVSAVPTNHTIDDAGPRVRYIPSTDGLCVGCAPTSQYDRSQLNNGTVTTYSVTDGVPRAIEMNFTGTAIYIFVAAASAPTYLEQRFGIALDVPRDGPEFILTAPPFYAQYNILAYKNTSLADGAHTLQLQFSSNTAVNFDYAVYTSNDPAPPESKRKPHAAAIAGGTVGGLAGALAIIAIVVWRRRRHLRAEHTSGKGSASVAESPLPPHGRAAAAKEASQSQESSAPVPGDGEKVASILAASINESGLPLLSPANEYAHQWDTETPARGDGQDIETMRVSSNDGLPRPPPGARVMPEGDVHDRNSAIPRGDGEDVAAILAARVLALEAQMATQQRDSSAHVHGDGSEALAAKLLALEAEVKQLKAERGEGSSSASNTDAASLTRSLSTMKRDQSRTVRDHQEGYTGADALMHTDSGLRLTAERTVPELPPTYAAE